MVFIKEENGLNDFHPRKIELSSQVESRLFLRERLSPQAIQSKL